VKRLFKSSGAKSLKNVGIFYRPATTQGPPPPSPPGGKGGGRRQRGVAEVAEWGCMLGGMGREFARFVLRRFEGGRGEVLG